MKPFLGVAQSFTGRMWAGPDAATARQAEAIVQATGQHPVLAQVLARLGVSPDAVGAYLAPTLRALMPDPSVMADADRAADRLVAAARARQRVAILADYDVDGACSAALLIDWFRAQGVEPVLHVPDRIDEGYGPNVPAMRRLAEAAELIVCVDCGTLAHEPIAAVAGQAEVLVLDHHQAAAELPPALAVVNPNRLDEDGRLGHLCAAGVVFMVLAAANRALRRAGLPAPDLMAGLDLVALATVADVAPLIGLNRAFVRQGLAVMRRRGRPGLRALADIARLDRPPTPYHLGFVLGPRINAGGRVGASDLGTRLLSTTSEAEAQTLAARLDALNRERRAIEAAVRDEALAQIEARGRNGALAWAAGEGWHPGVVGIVAARIKEATHRPAIVLAIEGARATGSARSVPGVDIGAIVARVRDEGLLAKAGGHAMAAGLTVATAGIAPAMARIEELIARARPDIGAPEPLRIDAPLMPGAATPELVETLEAAGPFGQGAPAPRLALPGVRLRHVREVGEGHLILGLTGEDGAALEAVAFRAMASALGPALCAARGGRVHIAGALELDHWGGRLRVRLRAADAAPAE